MSTEECNTLDSIFRSFNLSRDGNCCTWYGVACANGRVEQLKLFDDRLRGPIPAEMGKLTNLQLLYLARNQLSGPIPADLGKLTNLRILGLSSNQLNGSIPNNLGNLAKLEDLQLDKNQLSGLIPADLGKLTNLGVLYLDSNKLSGPIPGDLGKLTRIEHLHLYNNQFSGPIPILPNVSDNCTILASGSSNSMHCLAPTFNKTGKCWDNLKQFSLPECPAPAPAPAPPSPTATPIPTASPEPLATSSGLPLAAVFGIIVAMCAIGIISFVAFRRFHGRRNASQQPSDSESPSSSATVTMVDLSSPKPVVLDAARSAPQKPMDPASPSLDRLYLPPAAAQPLSKDHCAIPQTGGAPNQGHSTDHVGDDVLYLGDASRQVVKKDDDSDVLYIA